MYRSRDSRQAIAPVASRFVYLFEGNGRRSAGAGTRAPALRRRIFTLRTALEKVKENSRKKFLRTIPVMAQFFGRSARRAGTKLSKSSTEARLFVPSLSTWGAACSFGPSRRCGFRRPDAHWRRLQLLERPGQRPCVAAVSVIIPADAERPAIGVFEPRAGHPRCAQQSRIGQPRPRLPPFALRPHMEADPHLVAVFFPPWRQIMQREGRAAKVGLYGSTPKVNARLPEGLLTAYSPGGRGTGSTMRVPSLPCGSIFTGRAPSRH